MGFGGYGRFLSFFKKILYWFNGYDDLSCFLYTNMRV